MKQTSENDYEIGGKPMERLKTSGVFFFPHLFFFKRKDRGEEKRGEKERDQSRTCSHGGPAWGV